MGERQLKLLQDMMKFSKCSDGLQAVGFPSASSPTAGITQSVVVPSGSSKEKNFHQTPKKQQAPPGDIHFSGSAFLSSPDPSALPIPDFGDEPAAVKKGEKVNGSAKISSNTSNSAPKPKSSVSGKEGSGAAESSPVQDKTQILKKFLKVRKA
jgi:hypothetical protein